MSTFFIKPGAKLRQILRLSTVIFYGLLGISLAGCFSSRRGAVMIVLPPVVSEYSGPRANVTLADFDVRSPKATSEIGAQLKQMVAKGMTVTNRFVLVGPKDTASAAGSAGSDEPTKTPDLIISAAVTEFEPQVSGGSGGIGGGGGEGRGALGGLLGSNLSKAHMALEIRIADAATSKVLVTTAVQGQSSDVPGVFPGEAALGNSLSAYAKTPMEKAIRICVAEAVRRISESIPENYYKY